MRKIRTWSILYRTYLIASWDEGAIWPSVSEPHYETTERYFDFKRERTEFLNRLKEISDPKELQYVLWDGYDDDY